MLDRMVNAVERVRQRLLLASGALHAAGVGYEVVGENVVAARIATIDETAVHNTQDVDQLIRREDLSAVGLVDRSWVARLQKPLAERLQQLLDTPDG